jgi:hypothetical protein
MATFLQVVGKEQTLPQAPQLLLLVIETQVPPQQSSLLPQSKVVTQTFAASTLATPKAARAIPAKPRLNRFNACRRVTDWANSLASSSNLLLTFVCLSLITV